MFPMLFIHASICLIVFGVRLENLVNIRFRTGCLFVVNSNDAPARIGLIKYRFNTCSIFRFTFSKSPLLDWYFKLGYKESTSLLIIIFLSACVGLYSIRILLSFVSFLV
ncbi:hypothetical protein ES703_120161 [subsurface metagenome]